MPSRNRSVVSTEARDMGKQVAELTVGTQLPGNVAAAQSK
jgi:hypothetical protein